MLVFLVATGSAASDRYCTATTDIHTKSRTFSDGLLVSDYGVRTYGELSEIQTVKNSRYIRSYPA